MNDGHAFRRHRRYSPSQADRFFVCTGSTNLLKRVPVRPSSKESIEGTTGHEIVEHALANGIRNAVLAHEDHPTHFCVHLDAETGGPYENFYFSVQQALNYVYDILDTHPGCTLYLERGVSPPVENAPGEADGYCDIIIHVPAERLLYVMDYKHGAGITKNVKGNRQVLQYGAGAIYGPQAVVDASEIDTVVLVIMQPRAFHKDGMMREDEVTPWDLYEYLGDLDAAIAANEDPAAPLVPDDGGRTTDHCRFCDAKTVCPAREAKALAPMAVVSQKLMSIEQFKQSELPAPNSLDMMKLGRIRAMAPYLKKWLDDVTAHCQELIQAGYDVPGAKIVETKARRVYYGDKQEVAKKAAALAGVDPAKLWTQPDLLPVTQIEAMIVEAFKQRAGRGKKKAAAEAAKNAFAYLTIKQSSGNLVVVDETDPRPAIMNRASGFAQIAGALVPREDE